MMRIVTKRKLRYLCVILLSAYIIVFSCNAVVESQLNKEIEYFKELFHRKKDGLQGIYNPLAIKEIPEETIDALYARKIEKISKYGDTIDWSKLAYVNYATNVDYLCNTLIMFDTLKMSGTKAKLHLLVSSEIFDPDSEDIQLANMLLQRIENVAPEQVVIKRVASLYKPHDKSEWKDSLTKLLLFNQTEYERIVYLDSDATLKDNMDELFFIPSYIKFAAPLAYWLLDDSDLVTAYQDVKITEHKPINLVRYTNKIFERVKKDEMIYNHLPDLPPPLFLNTENVAKDIINSKPSLLRMLKIPFNGHEVSKAKFASTVMMVNPSAETYEQIMRRLLPRMLKIKDKFDMDLINDELYNMRRSIYYNFKLFRKLRTLFVPEMLVLPFGRYCLLTGSFRNPSHSPMMKNDILGYKRLDVNGHEFSTDLEDIEKNCKYIHFSDSPVVGKPWYYASPADLECLVDMKKVKDEEAQKAICQRWNSIYSSYMNARKMCIAKDK